MRVCAVLASFALCTAGDAFGWGFAGHQAVALLAQLQLNPSTKAKIDRLLAQEPGSSLASISTWADHNKNRSTAKWHYVNFSRDADCHYVKERDCPDGQCLVEATKVQLKVLSSLTASDQVKLTALKYLVHFIGDLHQPLHAGFADDRGGNLYQVRAYGRGTNLHELWDTGLLQGGGVDLDVLVSSLGTFSAPSQATELDPARIAEESCQIASQEGFYPARKVGQDYLKWAGEMMRARLVLAGARLAGLLNATSNWP
jgi:nuclease S1